MSGKPVIASVDLTKEIKTLEKMPLSATQEKETAMKNEDWLQELLEKSPQVLPVYEASGIDAETLICVGREIRKIDNLYINGDGDIVVVETKLWRNSEAKREVVAQIIDYAKELQKLSYDELNGAFRNCYNEKLTLFKKLADKYGSLNLKSEDEFKDVVNENLKNACILLMIVGDGIQENVREMVDFINPAMHYDIALAEIKIYDLKDGQRLVVPQLVTKVNAVERTIIKIENSCAGVSVKTENIARDQSIKKRILTRETFLSQLRVKEKEVFLRLFAFADTENLTLKYATTSFSLCTKIGDEDLAICGSGNINFDHSLATWFQDIARKNIAGADEIISFYREKIKTLPNFEMSGTNYRWLIDETSTIKQMDDFIAVLKSVIGEIKKHNA